MQRALEDGTTFADFKKDAKDVFAKRGFGSWRQETIFRTNIQTAYNVGRYKQMSEVADSRPYWMYDAVGDARTRPAHAALDGQVYPADHEFWNT
jgi:SPP1 gp7 family putative phage head morphogenesis protein